MQGQRATAASAGLSIAASGSKPQRGQVDGGRVAHQAARLGTSRSRSPLIVQVTVPTAGSSWPTGTGHGCQLSDHLPTDLRFLGCNRGPDTPIEPKNPRSRVCVRSYKAEVGGSIPSAPTVCT
jgi:hypothetical protein